MMRSSRSVKSFKKTSSMSSRSRSFADNPRRVNTESIAKSLNSSDENENAASQIITIEDLGLEEDRRHSERIEDNNELDLSLDKDDEK